jgi:hypothetical protein
VLVVSHLRFNCQLSAGFELQPGTRTEVHGACAEPCETVVFALVKPPASGRCVHRMISDACSSLSDTHMVCIDGVSDREGIV